MSKGTASLVSLLTAFAAFALMSSTAWAHAFFLEGTEIKEKVEVMYITDSGVKLESSIAGIKVLAECYESDSFGNLEEKGKSAGGFSLRRCELFEVSAKGKEAITTCPIVEPITFKFKSELITGVNDTANVEEELKPNEGTSFVEFEITTCVLKGKYKIEGSQICELEDHESQRPGHDLICANTGSKLTLSKEPAGLFTNLTIETFSKTESSEAAPKAKEWFTN